MPQGAAAVLRHELIGLAGVFERNVYLVQAATSGGTSRSSSGRSRTR